VLIGLQKNYERFIFFKIDDVAAFKSDLRKHLSHRVTCTLTVKAREFQLRDHKTTGGKEPLPLVGLNLGFTNTGKNYWGRVSWRRFVRQWGRSAGPNVRRRPRWSSIVTGTSSRIAVAGVESSSRGKSFLKGSAFQVTRVFALPRICLPYGRRLEGSAFRSPLPWRDQ
jgi:hypothetical protein